MRRTQPVSALLGMVTLLAPLGLQRDPAGGAADANVLRVMEDARGDGSAPYTGDVWDSDMPVRDQETIRKTFDLGAAARRVLEVGNVWGSIEIVGTDSNQVQVVVNRNTQAESNEKLELSRKEVTLEITELPGLVRLYVNGPFRCDCPPVADCAVNCGRGCGWSRRHEGYIVKMDFQIQVPRTIDLKLSTVNSGHIRVSDVKGKYAVHNVNGGIEMLRVAGSGQAHTVNGEVKVLFTENPRESSSFKSINGDIELRFVRDLSADFRFQTFNGGIYTDFRVTSLPARGIEKQVEGRKVDFRADRYTSGRVGAGGPEIKVENLNGDIRILEKQ